MGRKRTAGPRRTDAVRLSAGAIIGVIGLAACGGSSTHSATATTDTSASAPAQSTTSSQTSASNSTLSLGQSAQFAGGEIVGEGAGEEVSVTVQRVIDPATKGVIELGTPAQPPPAGMRRVAVKLSLVSIGTAPYSDSPGQELSLISKSTGGPVGQATPGTTGPGQCATDLSTSVNIASGETERGCVFFQVPSDQQISAVQYQTQGGGYVATWTVSP